MLLSTYILLNTNTPLLTACMVAVASGVFSKLAWFKVEEYIESQNNSSLIAESTYYAYRSSCYIYSL
ncbi:hypothetical protein [Paenibacillus assamensis]|uniref:hypothetical protein n=1 Tax=Paenibacillus assamensis TaxID=311244 RepID=UPI000411AC6C|nr:hypothetical protein [Paenibacillus assamensis]